MRPTTILSLCSIFFPIAFARPWNVSDPCPDKIKVGISSDPCRNGVDEWYCRKDTVQIQSMDAVHDVLKHCHNITSLELNVGPSGCSNWPERENFPFNRSGGDTYPALRTVMLEGYDFGAYREVTIEPPDSVASWLTDIKDLFTTGNWKTWIQEQVPVPGKPLKSNFAAWLDAMDWSQVEQLGLENVQWTDEMLEILPGAMTGLKKLNVRNMTFIHALRNHTLTHLTWVGRYGENDTVDDILAHQGQSLEALEFRCDEMACDNLTSFNMSILPELAPNLQHVSVNLQRNGSWPYDSLAAIASLPLLKTADIYMRLQSDCAAQRSQEIYNFYSRERVDFDALNNCTGPRQFQEPYLSELAALDLYKFMKAHKADGDLGQVRFRVGDFSPPWNGPVYEPPWLEGRSLEVSCNQRGKVEGQAWCQVDGRSRDYWETNQYGIEFESAWDEVEYERSQYTQFDNMPIIYDD